MNVAVRGRFSPLWQSLPTDTRSLSEPPITTNVNVTGSSANTRSGVILTIEGVTSDSTRSVRIHSANAPNL